MIYSRGQALITSSDEHVAHLMKAGRKCNKAAKVIRSATSHFAATHTPHIGLWREIWWTAEVELAHLQRTGEGLMACDCVHSHINSDGCHKLQQSRLGWLGKHFLLWRAVCVPVVKTCENVQNIKYQLNRWKWWNSWRNNLVSFFKILGESALSVPDDRHLWVQNHMTQLFTLTWWNRLQPTESLSNRFGFLSLKLLACSGGQEEPSCGRAPPPSQVAPLVVN